MATELTWLGHGSWAVRSGDIKILLDPFLDQSPTAPVKSDRVDAQFILVSHGHFDHVADVAAIAKRTGATVVANFEITEWFTKQHGIEKTEPMNLGGGVNLSFGRVTMTLAHHSSQLPDGSDGGSPGGFLVEFPEGNVYFACDTALFSDMRLIARAGIALAVLPIGDRYTMGPEASIEAVKLIEPKRVVPSHYNTWPPIQQDGQAWAARVRRETSAEPIVLQPGGKIVL
jgi:L-ascorbate metabolism protein UlaG (beta-lactamase superfamily)